MVERKILPPPRVDTLCIAYALELDCGHTDMKTIDGLCDYWRCIVDLPANFKADYKRLFAKQRNG